MEAPVIRVGIADEQSMVRCALRGYLEHVPGIVCVGEATCAEEAVELVRSRGLDVLVLDLLRPEWQDLDALRVVREASGQVPVIVLSACPADRYAAEVMRAGASAYLEKANGPAERIVREIRAAALARPCHACAQPIACKKGPGHAGDGAPPPDQPPAAPAGTPAGSEAADVERQSIGRTVFWVLLAIVSIAMTLPAETVNQLRSQSPWLDAAANLFLGLTLGTNIDHVVGFGALGIAARFACPRGNTWRCVLLLVFVAALTELVQIWSPGRDPDALHVLLDCAAAMGGFGLAWPAWIATRPARLK